MGAGGPQGSFLAPEQADRVAAFDTNAARFGSGSARNQAFIESYCDEPIHACGAFMACDPPCKAPPADAGPARDGWIFSD